MFEFQSTLENLDEVPQNYRILYTAGESGGFTMDATLAKRLDTSGLTTALDKERKLNKTVKDQVQAWTKLGASPDEVQTKLTELNDQLTKGAEGKVNWDKMKSDLEKGHATELSARDQSLVRMRTSVEEHLIDSEATRAISEAKGATLLLLPHVRSSVKVVEENGKYVARVVDKDGDPRGDSKGGFMSITDLVTEMKSDDRFARAFEASGNTGGGKPPVNNGGAGSGTQKKDLSPTEKIALGLRKQQSSR